MKTTFMIVPNAIHEPIRFEEYEEGQENLAVLVFGRDNPADTLGISTDRGSATQIAYDDIGLYDDEAESKLNERAMLLWGSCLGLPPDAPMIPLVGTFVFFGMSPDGGTTSVSDDLHDMGVLLNMYTVYNEEDN